MSNNQIIKTQSTPSTLIEKAIEKGVDTQQLKELMDLQERWEKKEAKKEFLEALSTFQTMVPVIKKKKTARVVTRTGGSYSYSYADLASISASIKDALKECGLSYRWEFEEVGNKLKCHCLVSHRSGHTEVSTMESVKDTSGAKNEIQQTGSTQTYLQRYSLIGALGLTTAEEDNDGAGRKSKKDEDDNECLYQWKEAINNVSTKIELNSLYIKNKKVIDSNPEIQGWMKEKQDKLKGAIVVNHHVNEMP